MNRRTFLKAGVAMLYNICAPAFASTVCNFLPQGRLCTAQVDFDRFAGKYAAQQESQWCWATCISMLYAYYGHPVRQARIVSEVYGSPLNMPALAGIVMAQQLNRAWVDDNGDSFTSTVTAAYDFAAGVVAISNNWVIHQLEDGHPIIVGAGGHAIVMTAIQYLDTPFGPNVVGGGAFDPWPGRGPRSMTMAELVMRHIGGALEFVATVQVT